MKVVLTAETYWKLKAQMLDAMLKEQQIQQAVERIVTAKRQALANAGLDPAKTYTLADADYTAVEQG